MVKSEEIKTSKHIILLITAIFISVFPGCNSASYLILPRPAEQVEDDARHSTLPRHVESIKDANLIIKKHNLPNTIVGIEQIDQKRLSETGYKKRAKYKLAPGSHTIYYHFVKPENVSVISSADLNISFSVKAGHFYEFKNYTQWDDKFPEKVDAVDFLSMVIDTTDNEMKLLNGKYH